MPQQPGWQNIDGEAGHAAWQVYAETMPDSDWLQVAKSDRRGRGTRRQLQAALLPIGTLALLICLVGAAGLTARTLRPVRKLIDVTRAVIESGDMIARVPIARANAGHELDELSALFNRMLARNEALIRAMGDALDNVSHDLRTPLTRLRSSAEASLHNPNSTNATRDGALVDTIEESDRVLAMLRTIMDISEAKHGMMTLHLESIEFASMAEEAVGLYEYQAEERGISLREEVPPGLRLHADRMRLQQVLANLLDNAVKYSTTGGEVLLRGGEAGIPAHETWLSVRDQGIGVPQSDLPRIWDRLYRGDHSRTTRDNGLGLSLVKAVVEAHGGRAEVKTAVGEGSTFTVYFPAYSKVSCRHSPRSTEVRLRPWITKVSLGWRLSVRYHLRQCSKQWESRNFFHAGIGIPTSFNKMKPLLLTLVLTAALAAVSTPVRADDYPIKTCVVTGDAFGGDLGAPIDVKYKGRTVRLCCKACVKKFNANPDKYVAILEAETAKQKK